MDLGRPAPHPAAAMGAYKYMSAGETGQASKHSNDVALFNEVVSALEKLEQRILFS